ncbi:MAG: dihydropteroate synthase [Parvularculaceae bacterium]
MARCKIMGVVNVTPDSFSDGGRFFGAAAAIDHGLRLAAEGADILDIGGESTRPGASPVDEQEELARVLPVIEGLAAKTDAVISVDTRKPFVARAALSAGATIWNDVSALSYSPESLEVAATSPCKIVLMHAQGDPETMQKNPQYDDVVEEVRAYLAARIDACVKAGVARERLIVDPGIGFGKTTEHNLTLLACLEKFHSLGAPILAGVSRKRFIAAVDRPGPAGERLGGSLAAGLAAVTRGADILRVHDVVVTRQALAVYYSINSIS